MLSFDFQLLRINLLFQLIEDKDWIILHFEILILHFENHYELCTDYYTHRVTSDKKNTPSARHAILVSAG